MQDTQSKHQTKPAKAQLPSDSQASLSTEGAHYTDPSTQPVNPKQLSLIESGSLGSSSTTSSSGYERIDGAHQRAEEDVAQKPGASGSSLYWKNVWNQAIWKSKPTSQPEVPNTQSKGVNKTEVPIPKFMERVLAAGVNVGGAATAGKYYVGRAKDALIPKSMVGEEKTTKGKGKEAIKDYTDSSSVSSFSSSLSAPVESDGLQVIKSKSKEEDEAWTLVEAPAIEDDWDMIPEANRLREVGVKPTFNARIRERLEAMKAEREANK